MIVRKRKKILKKILKVADYFVFLLVFPFCFFGMLFAIPWILRKRRSWIIYAKGNHKALILLPFSLKKVMNQGHELILPFQNPTMKWIGYLDPTNPADETEIKLSNDFSLIAWQMPKILRLMEEKGLAATSILFRELIAVFRITNYCVK